MLGAVHRLRAEGHELIGVFSFECDNVFNFNTQTQKLAEELDIPFTKNKPADIDMQVFLSQGADVFFSAGYPYKIPHIPEDQAYGLNLHPSLLPKGRGLMPTPHIILHAPEVCGFTIHKLSPVFDDGDIVYQKPLEITPDDDVETISARIAMAVPDVIAKLFANLPEYWKHAQKQSREEASIFPVPDEGMRLLNWDNSVRILKKTGKAFGRFGCLTYLDGKLWAVYNFSVWEEKHSYPTGTIVCVLSREVVVAAQDGFVCLKEYQELPQ
ncbi:MAG: methionyl-tRNA formyltransferase [Alphaproteobacteria bacterium]